MVASRGRNLTVKKRRLLRLAYAQVHSNVKGSDSGRRHPRRQHHRHRGLRLSGLLLEAYGGPGGHGLPGHPGRAGDPRLDRLHAGHHPAPAAHRGNRERASDRSEEGRRNGAGVPSSGAEVGTYGDVGSAAPKSGLSDGGSPPRGSGFSSRQAGVAAPGSCGIEDATVLSERS